jgi:amidase
MRPTQGRVPSGPPVDVWVDQLATEGPMARTVDDLGRLLATQAGHDARLPLSLQSPFTWQMPADRLASLKGLRIGWLGDLGGYLPMEDGVLDACREALRAFEDAGAIVEEASLDIDLPALWTCWLAWRRALAGARLESLIHQPGARDKLKPEAQWEYDRSRELGLAEFLDASQARTRYFHHMQALLGAKSTVSAGKSYDVLALPSAQVWPFPIEERWPKEIAGRTMDTYHRWMEVTIYATLAGLPAICVPAAFHPRQPWPMGLQLVAAHGADEKLLRIAAGYEAVRGEFLSRRPPAAR